MKSHCTTNEDIDLSFTSREFWYIATIEDWTFVSHFLIIYFFTEFIASE